MRRDEQCGRRAAGGEAAAADMPEHAPVAERVRVRAAQPGVDRMLERATSCRAGLAGRGMAFAGARMPHARSLGSTS